MIFKRFFLLVLLPFIFVSFVVEATKYELAICAIFQDEAEYLAEWIDFHKKQGVQKFYLYNNLSKDHYKSVLKPYIKSGLVKLIEWPYEQKTQKEWNKIQRNAYMNCIKEIEKYVTWCAFIDIDEFLFCPTGKKLNHFLREFKNFPGVGVNWVMYGTSHVKSLPASHKMLNSLVWRARDDHPEHFHVKSIVQPKDVLKCRNPHFFIYKNEGVAVTENKEPFESPFSPSISFKAIRINHYWSKDLDFFLNVKCERQKKWGLFSTKTIESEQEFNSIYDPISNYINVTLLK